MKKNRFFLLVFLYLFISIPITYSQSTRGKFTSTTINEFKSHIEGFFTRMSQTMAPTSLSAISISSYHVGNFPHFTIGWGPSFGIKLEDTEKFGAVENTLNTLGEEINLFNQLPGVSVPFPISVRVGGGGIPFDVGFHFIYAPAQIHLAEISTLNIGFDARFIVLEEQSRTPGISLGFTYLYTDVNFKARVNDFLLPGNLVDGTDVRILLQNLEVNNKISTSVLSVPARLSKKMSFFEPVVGLEPFFSINDLSLSTSGQTQISTDDGQTFTPYSALIRDNDEKRINSDLFNDTENNIVFSQRKYSGGLRMFAGFSFVADNIWFFNLELSYEPVGNILGVTLNNRIAF